MDGQRSQGVGIDGLESQGVGAKLPDARNRELNRRKTRGHGRGQGGAS